MFVRLSKPAFFRVSRHIHTRTSAETWTRNEGEPRFKYLNNVDGKAKCTATSTTRRTSATEITTPRTITITKKVINRMGVLKNIHVNVWSGMCADGISKRYEGKSNIKFHYF